MLSLLRAKSVRFTSCVTLALPPFSICPTFPSRANLPGPSRAFFRVSCGSIAVKEGTTESVQTLEGHVGALDKNATVTTLL